MDNGEQILDTRLREGKKLMFRVHCQKIKQTLLIRSIRDQNGPNFENCIIHKNDEFIIVNPVSVTYRRLKSYCIIWFGQDLPILEQSYLAFTEHIRNQTDLQNFKQNLDEQYDKQVQFWILGQQQKFGTIQTYLKRSKFKYKILQLHQLNKTYLQRNTNLESVHQFPSYSEISVSDNTKLNKQRFSLYTCFSGMNIIQARIQFVQFFQYFIKQEKNKLDQFTNILNYYKSKQMKDITRDKKVCMQFYTGKNGIYKLLNLCLRALSDSRDIAHIRLPFIHLCISIYELSTLYSEPMILYRRCDMRNDEIQRLQNLVGKFIQMNGFLSTTKNQKVINKFGNGAPPPETQSVKIKIKVPVYQKNNCLLYIFADIAKYSQFFTEEQVLFNALNTFKVINIDKKFQQIFIQLQYIDVRAMIRYSQSQENKQTIILNQHEKRLINNFKYQQSMFILNRTQGQVFWRLGNTNLSIYFYKQYFSMLVKKQVNRKSIKSYNYDKDYFNNQAIQLYYQYIKFFPDCKSLDKSYLIQIMKKLIINNKHLCIQFFFYIGKSLEIIYCFQRSNIYLIICYKILCLVQPYNYHLKWIVLSNIGINYMNSGKNVIAEKKLCKTLADMRNKKIYTSIVNYVFMVIPIIFYYQLGMKKQLNQNSIQVIRILKQLEVATQMNAQYIQLVKALQNPQNLISIMDRFSLSYKKTFNKPPFFIFRLFINQFLMLFIQIQVDELSFQIINKLQITYKCKQIVKGIQLHDLKNKIVRNFIQIIKITNKYLENCINNQVQNQQNINKQARQLFYILEMNIQNIKGYGQAKIVLNSLIILLKLNKLFKQPIEKFINILNKLSDVVKNNEWIKCNNYLQMFIQLLICQLYIVFQKWKLAKHHFLILLKLARKIRILLVLDKKWIYSIYKKLINPKKQQIKQKYLQ